MRVLLDCRMASWTGVGRYTRGLARALAARDDIELVQVAARGERPPVAEHQGAASVVAEKHPFTIAGARELGQIVSAAGADVVHCTHFPTPMPVHHPLVVTIHDLMPLLIPGIMPSVFRRAAYRYWNARAAKLADRIITPSHFTAEDVERTFPAAAGKTRVTQEAADDFANGPMGHLAPGLVEIADWPHLLSMGSTRAHKDLPTLLRAFARVAADLPDLRLLLVGADNTPFIDDVLSGAPRSVRERVIFTGTVDDPQLRTLYAGSLLFVFPSRCEGFGLPPLEAMAFGTPCIVAEAASLPEVVGDAARLFPPGNVDALTAAIGELLASEEQREELSLAGERRAREFSWAHTAEATVGVYEEVLEGGERGGARTRAQTDEQAAAEDESALNWVVLAEHMSS